MSAGSASGTSECCAEEIQLNFGYPDGRERQQNAEAGVSELVHQIEVLEKPLGKGLYRGLLKSIARAWRHLRISVKLFLSSIADLPTKDAQKSHRKFHTVAPAAGGTRRALSGEPRWARAPKYFFSS
jgi:hypothetical protein